MPKKATWVIRRYAAHRLYDTHAARYIDLEDIAEAVLAGADVRVLDAETDRDVTEAVIASVGRGRH